MGCLCGEGQPDAGFKHVKTRNLYDFDGKKFCFPARLACLYGIIEPQLWLLITNNNQGAYVYWLIIFKILFLTF